MKIFTKAYYKALNIRTRSWFAVTTKITTLTILLLYFIAASSIFFGVFSSPEWRSGYVSTSFLVSLIIIPIVAVTASFAFQLLSIITDSNKKIKMAEYESKFLKLLETNINGTKWQRAFLEHHINQWDKNLSNLKKGLTIVQHDYWGVCSNLYDLTHIGVECTSTIPLYLWDVRDDRHDPALIRYFEYQIDGLIARGIPVTRTFIIPESADQSYQDKFVSIAITHVESGVEVFYIDLLSIEESLRMIINTDLAIIDNCILLIGRQPNKQRMEYFYEFYNLEEIGKVGSVFEKIKDLFEDYQRIIVRDEYILCYIKYRKPLNEYPGLNDNQRLYVNKHMRKLG